LAQAALRVAHSRPKVFQRCHETGHDQLPRLATDLDYGQDNLACFSKHGSIRASSPKKRRAVYVLLTSGILKDLYACKHEVRSHGIKSHSWESAYTIALRNDSLPTICTRLIVSRTQSINVDPVLRRPGFVILTGAQCTNDGPVGASRLDQGQRPAS
jgi:hypothetical protein